MDHARHRAGRVAAAAAPEEVQEGPAPPGDLVGRARGGAADEVHERRGADVGFLLGLGRRGGLVRRRGPRLPVVVLVRVLVRAAVVLVGLPRFLSLGLGGLSQPATGKLSFLHDGTKSIFFVLIRLPIVSGYMLFLCR